MSQPTFDDMKLARDGHLWWGRADQPKWPYVRPIFDRMERAPSGAVFCTFPGGGALGYGHDDRTVQGPAELLYDVNAPHQSGA